MAVTSIALRNELSTLWAELYAILNSDDPARLMAAWFVDANGAAFRCGSDTLRVRGSRTLFSFEVTRRPSLRDTTSHLLAVAVEPAKTGLRVADMLTQLITRSRDRRDAYAAIARRGLALAPLGSHDEPLALAAQPALFAVEDVPRIGSVDDRIVELDYHLTLDPARALAATALEKSARAYGLAHILR